MELCDEYIHELIQLIPELNDFFHLPKYKHLRPKYTNTLTTEFQKKERELIRKYHTLLKAKRDKTFYDKIFYDDLQLMKKESRYLSLDHVPIDSLNNFPLDYLSSLQGETDYEFSDKSSYLDFLNRFKGIPAMTTTIIDNMKQGIRYKDTLPRMIVLDLRDQYQACLESDITQLSIPKFITKEATKAIQTYLLPSVTKLKEFLETEYLCHCSTKLGLYSITGGLDIYRGLLQEQTIQGLTPKDVYRLGLREVDRITKKLHELRKRMKFRGSLQEFYKHYNQPFQSGDQVLEKSKKIQKEIYRTIYKRYFDGSLRESDLASIQRVSDKKSRMYAFYIGTKRRGTYYVNTNRPETLNQHELMTLTLHETIPGHHLQLMTHNRSKKLPLYVQRMNNTGFVEGWGLYCENFTDLHTDKEMICKYQMELQRAVRLVVDTGINAFKWSYKKSFDYMQKHLDYTDEVIRNEIIRYICTPSQALSYKVGELTLLFLRDRYLKKYPGDIRGFHKLMFDIGPCSLDLLIKECIKRNL